MSATPSTSSTLDKLDKLLTECITNCLKQLEEDEL
jgi:hypothetical protein